LHEGFPRDIIELINSGQGGNEVMWSKALMLGLACLMVSSAALAQTDLLEEKEKIYAVIEDSQGKRLEGYLSGYPGEVTVSSEDKKEKSIPLKAIESIKIEKVRPGIPGDEEMIGEGYYSVRLQNSQEVFTLKEKYTLSIKTDVGVITREIDPDAVRNLFRNDSQARSSNSGFIRDKSAIFSLELKF
jgi:hypothetical protein